MFVQVVVVEPCHRWFQDVGCGNGARWLAPLPSSSVVVHRGFRLRARQTEVTAAQHMPRSRIAAEYPQPLGDLDFREPLDATVGTDERIRLLWPDELGGSGAVLADVAEQREGV